MNKTIWRCCVSWGVEDMFEGLKWDPQFEGVGESGRINREPPACPVAAKTRGGV